MEADALFDRQPAELGDRVDGAVAVVAGRADDGDGVVVDEGLDRGEVDHGGGRVDGGVTQLDAEEVAGLVERRVGGLGFDHVGASHPALLQRVLPIGQHGVTDAAGTPAGQHAHRFTISDRLGVEQVEGHGDDLALEPGRARAHVALQGVDVGVQAEGLVHEVVVVVVAAVHGAGALAGLPEGVFFLGHGGQFSQHLVPGTSGFGKSAIHIEPAHVGVVVTHGISCLVGRK